MYIYIYVYVTYMYVFMHRSTQCCILVRNLKSFIKIGKYDMRVSIQREKEPYIHTYIYIYIYTRTHIFF